MKFTTIIFKYLSKRLPKTLTNIKKNGFIERKTLKHRLSRLLL